MERNWIYDAIVVKVVDGDTIDFNVDCGFHIQHNIRTRLYGIDTPETYTEEGKLVRDWLRASLPIGMSVRIRTLLDKTDKYGRWLAVIDADCIPPSENPTGVLTLNDLLVQKGYAKIYMI